MRCVEKEHRFWQEGEAYLDAVAEGTYRGALAGLDAEQGQATFEVHVDDACSEMCGVIAVDDLMAIYARSCPGEYSAQKFEDFLLHGGPDAYTRFDFWTYGGKLHIVDLDLIGEEEDRPDFDGRVRIDGDRIAVPGEGEGFRRYLHARHCKVEPWEVPSKTAEELEGFVLVRYIAELPSYLALRSFLEGHVSDGEDNYFFVNKVLAEFVGMVRDECEPAEIVGSMQERGISFDSETQINKVLELMMNLANDIPIRSNNGWSSNQMLQREAALISLPLVNCFDSR